MTRVNVVPVDELSDQWLIAEYRELPRCLKNSINLENAPSAYTLGKGHMKWARKYGIYTCRRMQELIDEMKYRGFKTAYQDGLIGYLTFGMMDYIPNKKDIAVNRERLIAKYNAKPTFYRWTKRKKPFYL